MLIVCWSAKGGSGTTVIAAGLALARAAGGQAREADGVTLVDLAGDLPAVLGVAEPGGPGVLDWLRAAHPDQRALRRLAVEIAPRLSLCARGSEGPLDVRAPWDRLVVALRTSGTVIVDAGTGPPARALVDAADRAVLVTRACFLALRTASRHDPRPTSVVVVDEPGRALRCADVERALGAPVVARVPWDPAIARAVDAGLLAGRPPRSLLRPLRAAA